MKRVIILSLLMCSAAQAANEIRAFEAGATTCYAVVRETDGDVWYVVGQVFEAWGTGGRTAADYDIALTNKTGGMFVGNMDTNIGAGQYYIVSHLQVGGSPADTDPAIWQEYGDWTGTVWTPATLTSADIADSVWDEAVADHTTETSFGGELGGLDPNLALVLADTAELQTDWTNGGRLDLLVDAIKAITDILTATATTIAVASDTTEFTLTDGQATNDVYNGMTVYIQDADDSHWESRLVIDWTSAKQMEVDDAFGFTPGVGDLVYIWAPAYFPMDVWDSMPIPPPKPNVIDIDNRVAGASGSVGGTKTIDWAGLDP